MEKKKILIVSASFYPQNSPRSFRTTELAKEFARKGHKVVVYIPHNGFDYSKFLKENNLQIRYFGALRFKAVGLKGNRIEMIIRRALNRVLNLMFEYPNIEMMFKVSKHLRKENGYDLLISIAVPYPIHWGVAKARSRKNKIATVWVADCGDPYMGNTTDTYRKPFYFKYVEKWFCRKTDFLSIPIEGARTAYYPEFQEKIKIIPQGYELGKLKIPEYLKKDNSRPVFAYAGGFIPGKRDPGPVMDFISKCNVDFQFVVYTSQSSLLLPYRDSLGDKLIIREYIPREDLLVILAGMDFLINFDNNTHTQLPSKLIDYAITGRPVLNISAETDLSSILDFINGDYTNKMVLPIPENHDIRIIAEKFILLNNDN